MSAETSIRTDARMLIALDVDGTVIHEDETLSPAVRAEVTRVAELGHEVTLATGRSWAGAGRILRELGLAPEYVVCANGAVVMQRDAAEPTGYRPAIVETFDPAPVLERVRSHLPTGRFLVEDEIGARYFTEGMDDWDLEAANQVTFEELGGRLATRVVVVSPDHDLQEFLTIVEGMGLHQVTYAIGWMAWLDIAPDGVNKATGLEKVRERLGIPRSDLLAVGDGRNDIDMFRWAGKHGRAVAMGQAPDEVKAVATEVTASVQDDGLAQILATVDAAVDAAAEDPGGGR